MEEPPISELLSAKRGKKKKTTMTIEGAAKKKWDSPVPSVNAENPSGFAENCNGKKVTVLAFNESVENHFYRQGLFDLGDSILNEAEEPEAIAIRSQFFEMHQILEAVRVGNLEPALKWACIDREKLK
ncbi:hypothetical protein ACB098_11G005900 [Castanea mollissima]